MKYKLVPGSKAYTYSGGQYMYWLYSLSSNDIDGTWSYDGPVIARSIVEAKAKVLANLPEPELHFDA